MLCYGMSFKCPSNVLRNHIRWRLRQHSTTSSYVSDDGELAADSNLTEIKRISKNQIIKMASYITILFPVEINCSSISDEGIVIYSTSQRLYFRWWSAKWNSSCLRWLLVNFGAHIVHYVMDIEPLSRTEIGYHTYFNVYPASSDLCHRTEIGHHTCFSLYAASSNFTATKPVRSQPEQCGKK